MVCKKDRFLRKRMSCANKQTYEKCFWVFDGVQQRDAARGRRVSRQNPHLWRGLAGGDEIKIFRNSNSKFKQNFGHQKAHLGRLAMQNLLQSDAPRRFASVRRGAPPAPARRRGHHSPQWDLTCGQLWNFFLNFGIVVDAGCDHFGDVKVESASIP